MSFQKRGIAIRQSGVGAVNRLPDPHANYVPSAAIPKQTQPPPGTRPSPLDGRLTTSTGTRSLDALLAGHSGLALGTSILIEESGTTDFGGSLLKYYVAEGVVQGHTVHILGMPEGWGRELPGLGSGDDGRKGKKAVDEDKMKIAWRYERLGEFGASIGGGARERNVPLSPSTTSTPSSVFCHDFDLSKRLILPSPSPLHFIPLSSAPSLTFENPDPKLSPFTKFLSHLTTQLASSPPSAIHRVAIPALLSPTLYPPHASAPAHILQFLHSLRALLRLHSSRLTALITLPLTLFARTSGLVRWMELLSDGVLELSPFPTSSIVAKPAGSSKEEEPPQGMVKVHSLPILHEKGGGGVGEGIGDDLSFTLSRRKGMVIKPYSLPPVDGDVEAQAGGLEGDGGGKATKVDIEF